MRMPKIKKPSIKSVLLFYSVLLSTILIIGGFYAARSMREIISNLLFLPIVIFLWISLVQKIRKTEKSNYTDNILGEQEKVGTHNKRDG